MQSGGNHAGKLFASFRHSPSGIEQTIPRQFPRTALGINSSGSTWHCRWVFIDGAAFWARSAHWRMFHGLWSVLWMVLPMVTCRAIPHSKYSNRLA